MPTFDEFEHSIQDFLSGVDENIIDLNAWWAEHGPQWMQFIGGAVGESHFPVPPFALKTYQGLVGVNPKADEESLAALAEFWAEEAEATLELADEVFTAAQDITILWWGDGAPLSFAQYLNDLSQAVRGLAQTQTNIAIGVTEFVTQVVQARASYRAQVILMAYELVIYLVSAPWTAGGSLIVALGRMLAKVASIQMAMRAFVTAIKGVVFRNGLTGVTRIPRLAGGGVIAGVRAAPGTALRLGQAGIRAIPGWAGRAVLPAGIAGRRIGPGIQRSLIEAGKQLRSPALVSAAKSLKPRDLAEVATMALRGRGPSALSAGARNRLGDNLDTVVNAARQAVGNGATTWSTLGKALAGYGVKSAGIYGISGWVIQEVITVYTLDNLGVEGYQSNPAGLATAVVGAGLGGGPLAFSTTAPGMTVTGGVGGLLGYYGSLATEVLLNPDLSMKDVLDGEPATLNNLLKAGGADNVLDAILQGALGGGLWERYIGQAGLGDVAASFTDLTFAVSNIRELSTGNPADLSAFIGDARLAGVTQGSDLSTPVGAPAGAPVAGAGAVGGAGGAGGAGAPSGGATGSGGGSANAPSNAASNGDPPASGNTSSESGRSPASPVLEAAPAATEAPSNVHTPDSQPAPAQPAAEGSSSQAGGDANGHAAAPAASAEQASQRAEPAAPAASGEAAETTDESASPDAAMPAQDAGQPVASAPPDGPTGTERSDDAAPQASPPSDAQADPGRPAANAPQDASVEPGATDHTGQAPVDTQTAPEQASPQEAARDDDAAPEQSGTDDESSDERPIHALDQEVTVRHPGLRIGDVFTGQEHHQVPLTDQPAISLSEGKRESVPAELREQQADQERQIAEAQGPVRKLIDAFRGSDNQNPIAKWPDEVLRTAVDEVVTHANQTHDTATWKPVEDGWLVQGRYDKVSFVVEVGRDGEVRTAWLGGFAPVTTTAGTAAAGAAAQPASTPPMASTKRGLGLVLERLQHQGAAIVDTDTGVVTVRLPSGSTVKVKWAVDPELAEGEWYVGPAEHTLTHHGYEQNGEVTVVLSGRVRAAPIELVRDVGDQVRRALAKLDEGLPGPVGEQSVRGDSGRALAGDGASAAEVHRTLPTKIRTQPFDPRSPRSSPRDAGDRLVEAVSDIQAGRMPQPAQAAEAGHEYLAVTGDPAEGIKLAHHADGSTQAFTIEAKPGAENAVRVIPGEWLGGRQLTPDRIEVSTALTGDETERREQMAAMVDAGLRELHRTQPGTDLPHTSVNRLALAEAQLQQKEGPVAVTTADEPVTAPALRAGPLPVGQGVLVSLGGNEVHVRFEAPPGEPGDPQVTLPQLVEKDGQVWQASAATITVPGLPDGATWSDPRVQAALGKLGELLSDVGPLHTGAIHLLNSPGSRGLADAVQQATLVPNQPAGAYLLPDPLPREADPSVGPSAAGPGGELPGRYVVRLPGGPAGLAVEAQGLVNALARQGYQLTEVVDGWSAHGVPGLLVRGYAPAGEGATGQPIELRLLNPDDVLARETVARQGERSRLSPSEVMRHLDAHAGGVTPDGRHRVRIPPEPSQAEAADATPTRAPEWTPREPGWADEGLPHHAAYLPADGDPAVGLAGIHESEAVDGELVVLASAPPSESVVAAQQAAAAEVIRVMDEVAQRILGQARNGQSGSGELATATTAVLDARAAAERIQDASVELAAAQTGDGNHAEVARAYAQWRAAVSHAEAMVAMAQEAASLAGAAGLGRVDSTGLAVPDPPPAPAADQVTLARQLAAERGVRVLLHESHADGTVTRSRFTPDGERYATVLSLDQLLNRADDEGRPAAEAVPASAGADGSILLTSDPQQALLRRYRELATHVHELANELARAGFGAPNRRVVDAANEWVSQVRDGDLAAAAEAAPELLGNLLAEERTLRDHGVSLARSVEGWEVPTQRPVSELAQQAQAIANATGDRVVLRVTDGSGEVSRRPFQPAPDATWDTPLSVREHVAGATEQPAPIEPSYPVKGSTVPAAELVAAVAQRIVQYAAAGAVPGVDKAVLLPDGSVRLTFGDTTVVTRIEPDANLPGDQLPAGVAQVGAGMIKVSSRVPVGPQAELVTAEVIRRALLSLGDAARRGAALPVIAGFEQDLSRLLGAANGSGDAISRVVEALRVGRPESGWPGGLTLHTGDPIVAQHTFATQLKEAMAEVGQAIDERPAGNETEPGEAGPGEAGLVDAAQRAAALRQRAETLARHSEELSQARQRVEAATRERDEATKGSARRSARAAVRDAERSFAQALSRWHDDLAASAGLKAEAARLTQELGDAIPSSVDAMVRWLPAPAQHPGPDAVATAGQIARALGEGLTLEVAEAGGGRTRYEIDAGGTVRRTDHAPAAPADGPAPVALERLAADAPAGDGRALVDAARAALGDPEPGRLVRMTAEPTGALDDLPGAVSQLERVLAEAWDHIRTAAERATSSEAAEAAGGAFEAAGEAMQLADAIRRSSEELRQAREELAAAQQAAAAMAPLATTAVDVASGRAAQASTRWQAAMLNGQAMLDRAEAVRPYLPEQLRAALTAAAGEVQLANPHQSVDAARAIAAELGIRVELINTEADGSQTVHWIDVDGRPVPRAQAEIADPAASVRLTEALDRISAPVSSLDELAARRAEIAALAMTQASRIATLFGQTVDADQVRAMVDRLVNSMREVAAGIDPNVRSRAMWGPDGDVPPHTGQDSSISDLALWMEARFGSEVTVAHLAAAVVHETVHGLEGPPVGRTVDELVSSEVRAHTVEWMFYRWLGDQVGADQLPAEVREVIGWSGQRVAETVQWLHRSNPEHVHGLAGLAEITAPVGQTSLAAPEAAPPTPVPEASRVLSGVPMETVPMLTELSRHINQRLDGPQVTERELNDLLLAHFSEAISADGYVFEFGEGEQRQHLRIKLTLSDLMAVGSEVYPHEQMHRRLAQGRAGQAHSEGRVGQVQGGPRVNASWFLGLPVPAGGGFTARAWLGQDLTSKQYIEAGLGVEDNRGPAVPTEAAVAVEVADFDPATNTVGESTVIAPDSPGTRTTWLIGLPISLLGDLADTVTIETHQRQPLAEHELPHLAIMGMTGQRRVEDEILRGVEAAGYPVTDNIREQVRRYVFALPDNTALAARQEHGQPLVLNDEGRTFVVRHRAQLHREHAVTVGDAADGVYLEEVRVTHSRSTGAASLGRAREWEGGIGPGAWVRALGGFIGLEGIWSGSANQSSTRGVSADRNAIRVIVDRWTGITQAHQWGDPADPDGRPGVTHTVEVYDSNGQKRHQGEVSGTLVTRMGEPDAYRYGLPVAAEAVDAEGNLNRGVIKKPKTDVPLPRQLIRTEGGEQRIAGVGLGTVRDFQVDPPPGVLVDPNGDAAGVLRSRILEALRDQERAFLPDSGLASEQSPEAQDRSRRTLSARDIQIMNRALLEEQLTQASLEGQYNKLSQDGIRLKLVRYQPRSLDKLEHVEVVIRLEADASDVTYVGHTTDRHVVHLDIDSSAGGSTASVGQGTARNRRFGLTRQRVAPDAVSDENQPTGAGVGVGGGRGQSSSRSAGASQRGNVVHLFEHHGRVGVWRATHKLTVSVVDSSGRQRPLIDEPLAGRADIYLPEGFAHPRRPVPVTGRLTDPAVFGYNTALVTSVDATGITDRARAVMPMAQPGSANADVLDAMVSPDMLAAAFKELVSGGIHNDQFFRARWGRSEKGAVTVSARPGQTRFLGTADITTTGHFMFRMASYLTGAAQTWSRSGSGDANEIGDQIPGGEFGGGGGFTRVRGWMRAASRIAGLERIPLSFEKERRFHFQTDTHFRVDVATAKLFSKAHQVGAHIKGKVTWVLAESDAIDAYGKAMLDLPAEQVQQSLARWLDGDATIDRAVATRAAARLAQESRDAQGFSDGGEQHRSLLEQVLGQYQPDETAFSPPGRPTVEVRREVSRLAREAPAKRGNWRLPEYIETGQGVGLGAIDSLELRRHPDDPDPVDPRQVLLALVRQAAPGAIDGVHRGVGTTIGNLPGLRRALAALSGGDRLRGVIDSALDAGEDGFPLWVGEVPHQRIPGRKDRLEVRAVARIKRSSVVGERSGGTEAQRYDYQEYDDGATYGGQASFSANAAPAVGPDGLANSYGMELGRGRNHTVVRNSQQTVIRNYTHWAGQDKVAHEVEVVLEVRRSGRRAASADQASVRATLTGELVTLQPAGLATDSASAPPRWRDYREAAWLPDRHGVQVVEGEPLRAATNRLMGEVFGDEVADLEPYVSWVLSGDALPSDLAKYTDPGGWSPLDKLHRQSHPGQAASVNVRMRFTELVELQQLPENFGSGAERRQQELVTRNERRGRAMRPVPALVERIFGSGDDGAGGAARVREQSTSGVEATGGARHEEGAKELGPMVLLRLRYVADVQVSRHESDPAGGHQLAEQRSEDNVRGDVYLAIHKRDLPELLRKLTDKDAWRPAPGPDGAHDPSRVRGLLPEPPDTSAIDLAGAAAGAAPGRAHLAVAAAARANGGQPDELLRMAADPVRAQAEELRRLTEQVHADLAAVTAQAGQAEAAARIQDPDRQHERWLRRHEVERQLQEIQRKREDLGRRASRREAWAELHQQQRELGRRQRELEQWLRARDLQERARSIRDQVNTLIGAVPAQHAELARAAENLVKAPEGSGRARSARQQFDLASQRWQAVVRRATQVLADAAETERIVTGGSGPRWTTVADRLAERVWRAHDPAENAVEIARGAAAELDTQVALSLRRPDGRTAAYLVTPDGGAYRGDADLGLSHALGSLVGEPPVHAPDRQVDLLGEAVRRRLDIEELVEPARQIGMPLDLALQQAFTGDRARAVAGAARAGVDVDTVLSDADRERQRAELAGAAPPDPLARLAEATAQQLGHWEQQRPGLYEALREAGTSQADLLRLLRQNVDVRALYETALAGGADFASEVSAALARAPKPSPGTKVKLDELADLFGFGDSKRELAEFRRYLVEAGLPPANGGDPAAVTPVQVRLLQQLAAELALRHGLFDRQARRLLLEVDPGWLASAVAFREPPARALDVIGPPPGLSQLPGTVRQRLDDTARMLADRYYHYLPAGRAYRGGAPIAADAIGQIRAALWQFGAPYAAWVATQLPGSRFDSTLTAADLATVLRYANPPNLVPEQPSGVDHAASASVDVMLAGGQLSTQVSQTAAGRTEALGRLVGERVRTAADLSRQRGTVAELATAEASTIARLLGPRVTEADARRVINDVTSAMTVVPEGVDGAVRARLVWEAGSRSPRPELRIGPGVTVAHVVAAVVHEATHVLQGRPVGLTESQVLDRELDAHQAEWLFYRRLRDQVGDQPLPHDILTVADWTWQEVVGVAELIYVQDSGYLHSLTGLSKNAVAVEHSEGSSGDPLAPVDAETRTLDAWLGEFFASRERVVGDARPSDVVGAHPVERDYASGGVAWSVRFGDGTETEVRFAPTHESHGRLAGTDPAGRPVLEVPSALVTSPNRKLQAAVHIGGPLGELHARAQASAVPRHDFDAPLTSETIERKYGIPERNQMAFRRFAQDEDLVIDVRPTNPASVRWLNEGALPKPRAIKAKTINDYDLLLNPDLPRDSQGLVALFEPRMPAREACGLTDRQWSELEDRYEQRVMEWFELHDRIGVGEQEDQFSVSENGLVQGRGPGRDWRPITGDHDIFDMRRADGSRLSPDEEERIIEMMMMADMGVQHGTHMIWDPPPGFARERIYLPILASHQEGGEPLVRFAPGQPSRLVWAGTPVGPPGNSGGTGARHPDP